MSNFLKTYEYNNQANTVIISVNKEGLEDFMVDYSFLWWRNIFDHSDLGGDYLSKAKQSFDNDLMVYVQLNRIERDGIERILTFDKVNGQPGSELNVKDNGSLIVTFNLKSLYHFVEKVSQLSNGEVKSVTFTYPEELTDFLHEDDSTLVKTVRVDYIDS